MKNIGHFETLGEAWLSTLKKIYLNGSEREYTDNTGDYFSVKECFGLNVVITRPSLPDKIIDSYKDPKEYEWMVNNFTSFSTVSELHNANSYAERLYDYMGSKNQHEWVIKRLKDNPLQRSCTITTLEPLSDELYIPCVSMLDFQRRPDSDDILDLTVYCRALDLGTKGYVNMVMLTMILENICKRIGTTPGNLELIIKSAHYRTADSKRIAQVISDYSFSEA